MVEARVVGAKGYGESHGRTGHGVGENYMKKPYGNVLLYKLILKYWQSPLEKDI